MLLASLSFEGVAFSELLRGSDREIVRLLEASRRLHNIQYHLVHEDYENNLGIRSIQAIRRGRRYERGVWRSHGTSHIACSALPYNPGYTGPVVLIHQRKTLLETARQSVGYLASESFGPEILRSNRHFDFALLFSSLKRRVKFPRIITYGWMIPRFQCISWCLTFLWLPFRHSQTTFSSSTHDFGAMSHEKAMCRRPRITPGLDSGGQLLRLGLKRCE